MNGGRKKWEMEKREYTKQDPSPAAEGNSSSRQSRYVSQPPDEGVRAYLPDVKRAMEKAETVLVDVRSPKEFTGEITAPPEYPMEHAQRGGHIPRAVNVPWAQAIKEADGTFKSVQELRSLYQEKGITPDMEVIAYCRIGERSSSIYHDGNLNHVLEDKTKRGLEVRERNNDEKYNVEADKGMIHDVDGIGHKIGIRWYFPKSKYQLEDVIKIAEEMEAKYKAIQEMTCPDDDY